MIRSLRILKLSPFLLLTLLSSGLFAQTLPPPITTFTPEEYDAHPEILSTEALPDGHQAFGTREEVLIHNGESFAHIPIDSGKEAFSMDSDPSGRLFVGGRALMGVITPDSTGVLTFRSLKPLLPDSLRNFGFIFSTYCDEEGGVYFNALQHLFYYQGDTVKAIHPENRFFGGLRHPFLDGPVIQDIETGLFALSGTEKEYLPGSDSLAKGKLVMAILPAPGEKDIWTVFTRARGIYCYSPSTGIVRRFEVNDRGDHQPLREGEIITAIRLDPRANPYGAAYVVGTFLNELYLLGPKGNI